MLTDSVDEDTGEYEVEYVEEGPPPEDDVVRDVRVGSVWATRVVDCVFLRCVIVQIELAVLLVIGELPTLVQWEHIQLQDDKKGLFSFKCISNLMIHFSG